MKPLHTSLAALALFVSANVLPAQQVNLYRTSADLTEALARQTPLQFSHSLISQDQRRIVAVDESRRFQTMEGFGASLTDSSAWLLNTKLKPQQRNEVMQRLFSPTHGIGLSFLRQPLGSTDLSRSHTSYDDMPKGQADPELKYFSIQQDQADILPLVRQALKINPAISVMVTPWSPPAWMKTKDTMIGGGLKDEAMDSYASYLTRAIQGYQKAGVPVRYMSIQNEPLFDTPDYPGTLLPAAQAKRFIGEYLGPSLRKAGLSTEVLAYDHNWDHPEYPLEVLGDAKAAQYVPGTALHCYGGDVDAQNKIHDQYPEKGIWLTECSGGKWQKGNLLAITARLLIESSRDWAKSVVLWGMVLDSDGNPHAGGCGTCRGLVSLDLHQTPPVVTYTADYYGLAAASKFVTPGAVRIDSTSFASDTLETVAFLNKNGSVALIAMNYASTEQKIDVRWNGKAIQATLPAGSLSTFTWNTK